MFITYYRCYISLNSLATSKRINSFKLLWVRLLSNLIVFILATGIETKLKARTWTSWSYMKNRRNSFCVEGRNIMHDFISLEYQRHCYLLTKMYSAICAFTCGLFDFMKKDINRSWLCVCEGVDMQEIHIK